MSFFTAGLHIVLYNYQQGSYSGNLDLLYIFFKYKKKLHPCEWVISTKVESTLYSISFKFGIYAPLHNYPPIFQLIP